MRARILLLALLATTITATPVTAHTGVELDGYEMSVGMIGEPAAVGDDSGFEITVTRSEDDQPVAGIERTLEVSVRYGSQVRALTVEAVVDRPGHYVARFVPTVAGPYSIILSGRVEIETVAIELTAGADTYEEVLPASSRHFPAGLASSAEIVAALDTVRLLALIALLGGGFASGYAVMQLLRRPSVARPTPRRGRRR